ncbi:MAG: F0F1 ATP synthase subunit A [Desulfobacterales bacterium]
MDDLGQIHQLIIPLGGYRAAVNLEVLAMTGIAFVVALAFGIAAGRRRSILPGPVQIIGELLVANLTGLTEDALGKHYGRIYCPLICALFIFLLISNWLGILPHLEEPTRDLNTPLSLGVLGFFIAHYAGIREKGFKVYLRSYFEPVFFLMPLNLIGELAKIVSISFRLFGNIMGGAIIILVVSHLTYSILLPPFLNIFFGLFVGTIQAFVFTMLTVVYISVQVR